MRKGARNVDDLGSTPLSNLRVSPDANPIVGALPTSPAELAPMITFSGPLPSPSPSTSGEEVLQAASKNWILGGSVWWPSARWNHMYNPCGALW